MTVTTAINLFGIGAVAAIVTWAWISASRGRRLLDGYLIALQGALAPNGYEERLDALAKRTQAFLMRRGLSELAGKERSLLLQVTRAHAESARSEIASRIELMPQVGLLGTVLGLTLSMVFESSSMFDALGLALTTTLIGLAAAAIAKARLEPEADQKLQLILALTDNEELKQRAAEHALAEAA